MCEEKKESCELSDLVGLQVNRIGREGNMVDLEFGEDVTVTGDSGEKECRGAYVLTAYCPWRIVNLAKNKLYLGRLDIFDPAERVEAAEDFNYNTFEWNVPGQNLFDERAPQWFAGLEGVTVTGVQTDQFGDAQIKLSNGDSIEIRITATDGEECWRFVHTESDIGFMMLGNCDL